MKQRERPHRGLEGVSSVLSIGDFTGRPVSAASLKRQFADFEWRSTVTKLARLASVLSAAGSRSAQTRAYVHDLVVPFLASANLAEHALAKYVHENRSRPIATERTIYFAQSMAILYGSEDGRTPLDGNLVHLFLASNDYAFAWATADLKPLSRQERVFAELVRSPTYDNEGDLASGFARAAHLLLDPPPRTPPEWVNVDEWTRVQRRAFDGFTAHEYVSALAGPLYGVSTIWSTGDPPEEPAIDPSEWLSASFVGPEAGKRFIEGLAKDRDQLRSLLEPTLSSDGLPVGSAPYHRFPFILLGPKSAIAASPWVVREHIRGGIWDRMRRAAIDLGPRDNESWHRAFGDIVERWCQRVAEYSARSPKFIGEVLAKREDVEEVEDLVVVDKRRAILFSVKARAIPEHLLKGARSRARVVEWYDAFLFGKKTTGRRAGVMRQFVTRMERLRRGDFEPRVSRHAEIYPVLVTYDEYGLDNPIAYRWVATRMKELDIAYPSKTRTISFASIELFEKLMGAAENGHSLFRMLDIKTKFPWHEARLSELLRKRVKARERYGSVLKELYDDAWKKLVRMHFPRETDSEVDAPSS